MHYCLLAIYIYTQFCSAPKPPPEDAPVSERNMRRGARTVRNGAVSLASGAFSVKLGAQRHGVVGGGPRGCGRGRGAARARRGSTRSSTPPPTALPQTLPLCPHRVDRGQVRIRGCPTVLNPSDKNSLVTLDRVAVAAEMNSMALGIIGLHGFPRESSPLLAVGSVSEAFHHSYLSQRYHRIYSKSR
ncbi:jg6385 [Pararge aegeria aegeria]|uniref:Jg6385 protein n=1 Tax=Pararge aegeria aegeria TaxID=348720 RepID=A0A8S4RRL6_9NEOP|nr:jg6385 [Pararge aegeria aegeria]